MRALHSSTTVAWSAGTMISSLRAAPLRHRSRRTGSATRSRIATSSAIAVGNVAAIAGAPDIERVDSLAQSIAARRGMHSAAVAEVVAAVEARLSANRQAH